MKDAMGHRSNMHDDLIEAVAMAIYCDSYTDYGTCSPDRWKKTTEGQRKFFRGQAAAVLTLLHSMDLLKVVR